MAWSWKKAGAGGTAGAATGAGIGSAFGPVGTAIGGGVGLLLGGLASGFSGSGDQQSDFSKYLFGTPEGQQLLSKFSPEQQQELINLLASGRENMQNPYMGFEPIRQNALNSFRQQIIPEIAHSFSANGNNALSSPVLHSRLAGAGANLISQLAAQEAQYGQTNKEFGLEQQRLGLSPQYGNGGLQHLAASTGLAQQLSSPEAQQAIGQFVEYMKNRQLANSNPAAPQPQNYNAAKSAVSPFNTVKALQRA